MPSVSLVLFHIPRFTSLQVLGKKEDKREAIDIVKLNAEIKETVTREQVLKDRIIAEIEG